ncbi:golgin subfamily A member 6-like protein 6 [Monomorium pharaonis]|uniref:golgin subfamily A member 6-like protein 6 n=1 Tax=Monomorium pharaonis TaxID=307658 RepID=UPI00063F7D88|nr:golgin subfamily A member 6-like protein 6 [Monomorium pharaonis]
MGKKEWHSKEWKRKKRYLRAMMRRMKKGKISREDYVQKRKHYKEWCKEEKKRHEEKEERKIKNISTEKEAWKYINKYRKKREGIDEEIELGNWKKHFMDLLRGKEERITWQQEEEENKRGEEVTELTTEELDNQWKKLKMEKVPEEDDIENEAWKYMSGETGEVLGRLLNGVWKKHGKLPGDWIKGIICPIFKKGEKSEVGN